MHYPFQDRCNLYIRDHATDQDVFELVEYIDTATIRIVGTLVRFFSGWDFEAEIPLEPEHVRLVAEFVAQFGRPTTAAFPRRNLVDFSILPADERSTKSIPQAKKEPRPEPKRQGSISCLHERLNEEGICRNCGSDERGVGKEAMPVWML